MSTPYQILNSNASIEDIELDNRFYKWRNIERFPQSDSNFLIFQQSMFARLKAQGLILVIYAVASIFLSNVFYSNMINIIDNLNMCGFPQSTIIPEV